MVTIRRRQFVLLAAASAGACVAALSPWGVPLAEAADAPPPIGKFLTFLDDLYRAKTSVGRMEMTIVKPSRTRSMTMKSWSRGMSHSLIVVESPARDKGTATLKVDENLWNYLPKISRTVRIPPSMMLGSWMGSDMTNDDLVKEASYADDFDASWDGKSTSPAGWKLKLVAKPGKVGLWKRIEMVVNEDATLPIQSKYYDRKDRLARTMYFEEVKELGGRKIPSVMRLVPEDKKGEYTVMKYLDIQFDVDVPESTFSLSRLKHGR
jgi:outer membrane lipoprotein-sorting protein